MAVLISKVVRSSSVERVDDRYSSGNHTSNHTNVNKRTNPWPDMPQPDSVFPRSGRMKTNISGGRTDGLGDGDREAGIMKTVTTVVKSDSDEESCEGHQLSTKNLVTELEELEANHV
jgi:hypothetical protein